MVTTVLSGTTVALQAATVTTVLWQMLIALAMCAQIPAAAVGRAPAVQISDRPAGITQWTPAWVAILRFL